MDSATHLIDTPTGAYRLVAGNNESEKMLIQYEDSKVIVTVCGYLVQTPKCLNLNVYSVYRPGEIAKLLDLY